MNGNKLEHTLKSEMKKHGIIISYKTSNNLKRTLTPKQIKNHDKYN